jgi:hypothetical protein
LPGLALDLRANWFVLYSVILPSWRPKPKRGGMTYLCTYLVRGSMIRDDRL